MSLPLNEMLISSVIPLTRAIYASVGNLWDFPLHLTEKKLEKLLSLEPGWYFGDGAAPSEEVYQLAFGIHDSMLGLGFLKTDAFPGVDGEIVLMLSAVDGDVDLEFTIKPDLLVSFAYMVDGNTVIYQEGLSRERIEFILRKFWAEQKWNLSGYLVSVISNETKEDSLAQLSKTITIAMAQSLRESLSLVGNVYWTPPDKSVIISEHSMRALPKTAQSFSGTSHQTYFQLVTA